ncbi:AAA family ATPase [Nocardioides coralli]|uniref:AAA family ATPase n=1 Tax=Nocardioides coralli TaxID=2872154 RepID=UPI001CA3CFAE|nr:hypothetical protein [Nocardioides coralli]QZY28455.1 hypothetical protein K6T13_13410 [Nocardioides coralli]
MVVVTLVLAAGAAWESTALGRLADRADVVVLRRCMDVAELLATAASGQAEVAVVAVDAPGLDRGAVDHLRGHGVRVVAVRPAGPAGDGAATRATRIGIRAVVADDELDQLAEVVAAGEEVEDVVALDEPAADPPRQPGRVVVVWGPAGAPGRTTLAVGLAAELARERRTVLVDADPYGGAVAQQLGIVDEVAGILAAARASGAGKLPERFGSVQRSLDHRLSVVTGLPRPDRWVEVRPGVVEQLLEVAAGHGSVVVDTGFSLERDAVVEAPRPDRNTMTLAALEAADDVVVVGSADPVGLSRLARGLADLRELTGAAGVRVVVNRMRPTLGWAEQDIAGMLRGVVGSADLRFLPDDRVAVDRALVAGRTLVEGGDSALGRAIARLAADLAPQAANSR